MAATGSRTASPQASELLLELDDPLESRKPTEARSSAGDAVAPAGGASNGSYDADSIETLEGLEAVRKRPAMYVGGNGSDGLMHLVWEIVDNSVDEAAAGFATKVEVTLHRNGSVEVVDDGRGIPVDKHPDRDVSALEVVFSELHAGGKVRRGGLQSVRRSPRGRRRRGQRPFPPSSTCRCSATATCTS